MAAPPPGSFGWGPPPPHMAHHGPPPSAITPYPPSRPPPYHPQRPPPGAHYGPPPGYPYHGYPPAPHHRGGYGPPPEAPPPHQPHYREHRSPPRSAPPPVSSAAGPGGNYAEEKPAAYQAFKERAVRIGAAGAEVSLSGGMCEDRHVNDFIMCLQCWLWRTFGDPRSTGRPWRLKRLDLSKNSLSDESLRAVIDSMKRLDLRVERVFLSGNRLKASGLASVTEYLWNCQDAVWELDLSDNEVHADPGRDDNVSALLRCLYNHSRYPVMLETHKALPLSLRLSGNFIRSPERLLSDIRSKGCKDGKPLIRICDSPESYIQSHEEFLSVCLPDFSNQRLVDGGPAPAPAPQPVSNGQAEPPSGGIRLRSRSRRRRRRKEAEAAPAPAPVQPAPVEPAPAPVPVQVPAEPAAAPVQEGNRQRQRRKREKAAAEQKSAGALPAPATVDLTTPAAVEKAPLLTEEEQQRLQSEVGKKLAKLEGLPSEQSTCEMLSEFTVCMLVARKTPTEVEAELESFLGEDHAGPVATWFAKHVRHHYKAAAKMAGWK